MDNFSTVNALLPERYGHIKDAGAKADESPISTSEVVLSTLLLHRSIRRFRKEALASGTLEVLIACGQSAATSSNLQAWSVIALENEEHKDKAAVLCGNQDFIRQAPLFLVFCADLARLTDVSAMTSQPGEALAYTEMFLLSVIDTALAAQNVAVAAEALGLGICYVGAARNKPQELAELLKLPERTIALFGMAVGFPESVATGEVDSAIKPRLPIADVLHREVYSTEEREFHIAEYDAAMRRFYDAQAMNVAGSWSTHSARRVASESSLAGRHTLRDILQKRGFELR